MSTITRTIYGSRIQSELLLGIQHSHIDNTTLNEKFDIQAGVMPANNVVPTLGYFCIGMGGHRNMTGAESQPYPEEIKHSPSDAALYRHLPFLLREMGNDLTTAERQRYAMRKLVTINGTSYIAYYLRRLSKTGAVPQMLYNVPNDTGGETITNFVPTGSNLNPTAPAISPTGVVTTDGSYLSASSTLSLSFSESDVSELLEVGRIMFDNPKQVVISEFGLVAGVDQVVTSSVATGSVNYIEALQATVIAHITAFYAMAYQNQGLDHTLEVGAIEPLLVTGL